jgi:transposase
MGGQVNPQSEMFGYCCAEKRVPADHPLHAVGAYADSALKEIRPLLDELYGEFGRPSIPPERLLKTQLLIALYSERSDRLFCEMRDYDILYRWLLDMGLEEPSFDASSLSKNRERLAKREVGVTSVDTVVRDARRLKLLSDERFSVNGKPFPLKAIG